MAVDGFSLLHAAYGLLAAWILRRVLDDADVIILIIVGVAIAWEVIILIIFGLLDESDYVGDRSSTRWPMWSSASLPGSSA